MTIILQILNTRIRVSPFFDTRVIIILNALHFKFASQQKSDSRAVLIHLLWYMPANLLQL